MPKVVDVGVPDSSVNSAQICERSFAADDDARYPRDSLVVSVIPHEYRLACLELAQLRTLAVVAGFLLLLLLLNLHLQIWLEQRQTRSGCSA